MSLVAKHYFWGSQPNNPLILDLCLIYCIDNDML